MKICLWSRYLSYNYPIYEQKHRLLIPVFAKHTYFSRSCSRIKMPMQLIPKFNINCLLSNLSVMVRFQNRFFCINHWAVWIGPCSFRGCFVLVREVFLSVVISVQLSQRLQNVTLAFSDLQHGSKINLASAENGVWGFIFLLYLRALITTCSFYLGDENEMAVFRSRKKMKNNNFHCSSDFPQLKVQWFSRASREKRDKNIFQI